MMTGEALGDRITARQRREHQRTSQIKWPQGNQMGLELEKHKQPHSFPWTVYLWETLIWGRPDSLPACHKGVQNKAGSSKWRRRAIHPSCFGFCLTERAGNKRSSFPGSGACKLCKILFLAEYKSSALHDIYILEKLSV